LPRPQRAQLSADLPKGAGVGLGFLCGGDRLGRCKDVLRALTERGIGLH